jgi:hypothetical protein
MASSNFPKLLVVAGFPPTAPGGGSAVTQQLLTEWPRHALSWWCPYPQQNKLRDGHLSWPSAPNQLFPNRRLRRIKTKFVELLWVPLAAAHLRRTIAHKAPDVVWCIPHEWSIPVASAVLTHAKPPYAIYIQDYPITDQLCKIIGTKTAFRWMQMVEALVSKARFVDTTSYPMGEDIALRTGCKSTQMLHEGLEFADFTRLSRSIVSRNNQSLTLAFAGTVVAEGAFAKFIHALEHIRKNFEKPILLEFFSSHNYSARPWFNPTWMSEHGYKDRASLIDSLQYCHAGLVVMDSEEANRNYNRFSFPTKFITYIAAGIEPLVVGHSSSAVSTLARQSGVGIQMNDTRLLDEALRNLMRDKVNSEQKRRQIITFARLHFDAARKRRQFLNQMLEIVRCA